LEAPRVALEEALMNLSIWKTQIPEQVENESGIIDVKSISVTITMAEFHLLVKEKRSMGHLGMIHGLTG